MSAADLAQQAITRGAQVTQAQVSALEEALIRVRACAVHLERTGQMHADDDAAWKAAAEAADALFAEYDA